MTISSCQRCNTHSSFSPVYEFLYSEELYNYSSRYLFFYLEFSHRRNPTCFPFLQHPNICHDVCIVMRTDTVSGEVLSLFVVPFCIIHWLRLSFCVGYSLSFESSISGPFSFISEIEGTKK